MNQPLSDQHYCLNCEKILDKNDAFCKHCGQKNSPCKIPLSHFIQDFLGDYFTWDSKIFKSIIPLIIRPGYLTSEYINGKRAKYIPPFRVFIIISVIFFLLFSAFNNKSDDLIQIKNESIGEKQKELNFNVSKQDSNIIKFDFGNDFNPDSARHLVSKIGLDAYVDSVMPHESAINKFAIKQLTRVFLEDRSNFGEVMLSYSSKLIFLMLPLFALMLKLIYIRKKRYFYEHFIFSLHFHSFLFIYLIFQLLFEQYLFEYSPLISLVLIFGYLFLAMKKVYGENIKKTIGNFVMLSISYLVLFIPLFFLLLLFTSIILY